MIWKKLKQFKKVKVGEDKLMNPIYQLSPLSTIEGRISSWSAEDIQMEGRDITNTSVKYILKGDLERVVDTIIEDGSKQFEVTKVIQNSPRLAVVAVKKYG